MLKYFKLLYYLFYRPKIFFPKKSYSLFQEDLFIKKYFKSKMKGFFIDVGSYHPLDGNNTQLLYKKGWQGINFDINDYLHNKYLSICDYCIKKNRFPYNVEENVFH